MIENTYNNSYLHDNSLRLIDIYIVKKDVY